MKSVRRRNGRPRLYKWDEWFKHRAFTIKKYLDYHVGNGAMVQQIRNEAYRRGWLVSMVEGDLDITVTITGPVNRLDSLRLIPFVVSESIS